MDTVAHPQRLGNETIAEVYARYGVPHQIDPARGGWINTHCCWCAGSADYHLGYSLARDLFRCWRCGSHPTVATLEKLLRVGRGEALDIYHAIRSGPREPARGSRDREAQARVHLSRYRRPGDVGPMRANHRRYLERRGFDSGLIEREWGVLSTGPVSFLDGVSYRHRLLIPVIWDGHEVSFQARDVTGRSDRRYMACPAEREVRHHKDVLYGRQERWGSTGVVVEGVTDAWRLGPAACATFGTAYTTEQVREIARAFKRVTIVFDGERQAQAQAKRLANMLYQMMKSKPAVIDLGDGIDPGSLSQDDADHLVSELTK